jgi:hypothetical protein
MTLSDDARVAYLFSCPEAELLAVTLDREGKNLPSPKDKAGWRFEREFLLGVHEVLPMRINPEPLLRGIDAQGYFIWKLGSLRNPSGTSQ